MRILLAVDESPFSEAAVDTVIAQCRAAGTEVHVYHAVEWLREMPQSFRFGQGPTFDSNIVTSRNHSFERARQLVERVAQRLQAAGFRTTTATPDADARQGIVDCAAEWNADLIVLGSHGRRGVERWLLGSVAEAVVRHARCSVEIVRSARTATVV
jgi:nucleotide-binding universal stress UspA family protein